MKKQDLECSHKPSLTGYCYNLVGSKLWLCVKCEKKLRKQVLDQNNLEIILTGKGGKK